MRLLLTLCGRLDYGLANNILSLSISMGRLHPPYPIDIGLGCVTCFGQWDAGEYDVSRWLKCTHAVAL